MSARKGISKVLIGALISMVVGGTMTMPEAKAEAKTSEATDNDGQLLESYTVNKVTKVEVLQRTREGKLEATGHIVNLSELADITILESNVDAVFGDVVHVGIDDDDGNTPSDFWIRATELSDAALQASEMGSAKDAEGGDPALFAEDDSAYTGDNVVEAKRRRAYKKRMTYCYRYVKQFLLKSGKVSNYLPGGSAWMASRYLPAYGFRPTNRRPQNARDGDVCVYRGGSQGHGHIEVKRPAGWWYGYGYSGPITEKVPRQLIGCYVK